jgi:DNA-directed RNA polymerase specialized sigma24 family protein
MHTIGSLPQVEELPGTRGEAARLLQAIHRLPRELRQTVILHDVVRLPREEIAARLGCPVTAVRERVNRARLHLLRSLRTDPAIKPVVTVSAEVAETQP